MIILFKWEWFSFSTVVHKSCYRRVLPGIVYAQSFVIISVGSKNSFGLVL